MKTLQIIKPLFIIIHSRLCNSKIYFFIPLGILSSNKRLSIKEQLRKNFLKINQCKSHLTFVISDTNKEKVEDPGRFSNAVLVNAILLRTEECDSSRIVQLEFRQFQITSHLTLCSGLFHVSFFFKFYVELLLRKKQFYESKVYKKHLGWSTMSNTF